MEWFRGLPGVPKLIMVGVAALILLVLLSPVAMALAGVLLVVSVIALAIRVYQKGPIRNWGMVAVASAVLLLTFGGVSGVLYGDTDVAYEVVSEGSTGNDSVYYHVVSSSNDLESLNLVAQEIRQERLQRNVGVITFYESPAEVESGDFLGLAVIYRGEERVRALFSDLPLSPDQVEQVVDALASNGYVHTRTIPDNDELPKMPGFLMETYDPANATG